MTSDADRYARMHAIFDAARSLDGPQRRVLVDRECADDDALRAEVDRLLGQFDEDMAAAGASDAFAEPALAGNRRRLEDILGSDDDDDVAHVTDALPGYRIVARIAEGGMGIVYEAEQEHPRRAVAIKVLRSRRPSDALLARFRREAAVLARLEHPGIARIYDAGVVDLGEGARPYLTMELVRGVSITTYADREHLSVRDRMTLLAQACDAVEYAHGRHVIHRDLKPANLLVDESGRVRLVDFGIARLDEDASLAESYVTQDGQLLGTLAYMAPEQLRSERAAISPRTDVYGLGVVGFELIAGHVPHDVAGLGLATAVQHIESADAPPLGTLHQGCRGDVEAIISTALRKDPPRRYASAAAMAADIRRWLADEPIVARMPSRAERMQRFVRRNRVVVGAATAVSAALAIGLAVAIAFGVNEREQRRLADRNVRLSEVRAAQALINQAAMHVSASDYADARFALDEVPEAARGWGWNWVNTRAPFLVEGTPEFAEELGLVTSHPSGRVWDLAGRELPLHPPEPVSCLAAQPDGRLLFGTNDGLIGAVDPFLDRWTPIHRCDPATASEVVDDLPFSSSWVGESAESVLRIAAAGTRIACVRRHECVVFEDGVEIFAKRLGPQDPDGTHFFGILVIDPDGRFVVACTDTFCAIVWDVDSGQRLFGMPSETPHPITVALHPDGSVLALDRTDAIAFVSTASWSIIRTWPGGRAGIQYSENGDRLFVRRYADGGRQLSVYDAEDGQVLETFTSKVYRPAHSMEFSASARWVGMSLPEWHAPGSEAQRLVVDRQQDVHAPSAVSDHGTYVYGLAQTSDGAVLASWATESPEIKLWDGVTGRAIGSFPNELGRGDLAFDASDRALLGLYGRRSAEVRFDLVSGVTTPLDGNPTRDLATYLARLGDVGGVQVSSRTARSADGRCTIRIPYGEQSVDPQTPVLWSANHGGPLPRPLPDARAVAIHPTRPLAAFAVEHRVVVVDLETGATVHDAVAPGHLVFGLRFSPDGARLALGTDSGRVILVETEFWLPVYEFQAHPPEGEYYYVFNLDWSPDGTRLITASGDGTLRIWDSTHPVDRERTVARWETLQATMRERLARDTAATGDALAAANALLDDPDLTVEEHGAARIAVIEAWGSRD